MNNFKPITQIFAAILLAVFCFSDMPFIYVLGWIFVLLAFDLFLDIVIKVVKEE